MTAPDRPYDADRESRHFEATDELLRAALGLLQFHYSRDDAEYTQEDVVVLHQRLTKAAMAYLDAPSIYPWRSA
ncbi:hypothetical protein [uncultured Arthrobacter sp.]|uniref:hypothetical protein n=1 Tax=uncultured Arthrobacter sp. TaxID=114050 RepID=UPI0025FDB8F4|nr:hypothetical protein [uncultured Arthrobacter sp.]